MLYNGTFKIYFKRFFHMFFNDIKCACVYRQSWKKLLGHYTLINSFPTIYRLYTDYSLLCAIKPPTPPIQCWK